MRRVARFLEIQPRAKNRAGTAQDEHALVRFHVRRCDRGGERLKQGDIQSVAAIGTIQSDRRYLSLAGDRDKFGHRWEKRGGIRSLAARWASRAKPCQG